MGKTFGCKSWQGIGCQEIENVFKVYVNVSSNGGHYGYAEFLA